MAEASSPPSMDIDVVVDLHTNSATAASAAQALLNENSSNASSDAGFNIKIPVFDTSSSDTETDDYNIQRNRIPARGGGNESSGAAAAAAAVSAATSTAVEGVRSSSPPPNCAICLGRCKNKCFTDSCVHQFCFKCLCEWSKVKAECPLCKQAFRSIIHNVKAIDQYEEYLVQQPVVQIPHSPLEVTYQSNLNGGFIFNGTTRRYYNFSMRSWPSPGSHNVMGSRGGPITIRNYMNDDELSIPSAGVAVNHGMDNPPMRRSELLNLYRQELPDEISSTMSLSQLWRRYIYDRKLYALPVSDITGRYRESSARFYRNNPGQRIRLIPFANRDIVCLLRNTNHDVSTVLESLNEGLEVSNILSRSFRRRLQPYLGERTAHFIHELSNFARSPYDMIGYDRAVQYAPQAADEDHVIEFPSSSDEETNNNSGQSDATNTTNTVNLSSNEGPTLRHTTRRNVQPTSTSTRTRSAGTSEFRVQSRSSAQAGMHSPMSLLSFTITTTSEGSETPGLSVAVSAGSRGHAQVAAINLSTHNRAHNEVVIDLDDTVELNGSSSGGDGASTTNVSNSNANGIGNNDTASPAPAANSVPEGSPQVVASIALSTSSSDECEFVLERKPPHLRTPEMVSLNSESDSDVVFVDETKPIMAEATYSTSENDEQPSMSRLMNQQQDLQQPSTSTGLRSRTVRQLLANKRQSTSSQHQESSPSKKRRMRTRRMNTPPEYSTDGSTSNANDNSNDSEYNAKRQSRGRGKGRKRGTRTRKRNSSRRTQKKSARTMNPRNEMPTTQDADQDSNATLTNEPNMKNRRISTKRNSTGSKTAQNYSSSTKHTSSSDEESSTEEDDKMNLRALQLRLKKSLSDVEDNMKTDPYDYSIYSPPTRYDEMSRESNLDTANSMNSLNINNNDNGNGNNVAAAHDNSLQDGPSCSTAILRRQANTIIAQKLVAGTTPPTSPQRPTTSAAAAAAALTAAAAAAAAAAVASISPFNKRVLRTLSEESNASEQDVEEEDDEEEEGTRHAHFNLGSLSPASLSSPFEPQAAMAHIYSPGSMSSIESYQLPSTSRKHVQTYTPAKIVEPSSNAHLNDSDSSTSSTTSSSSSSSSAFSGSEDERDSDGHPLA